MMLTIHLTTMLVFGALSMVSALQCQCPEREKDSIECCNGENGVGGTFIIEHGKCDLDKDKKNKYKECCGDNEKDFAVCDEW